jgi:hypothetical protein
MYCPFVVKQLDSVESKMNRWNESLSMNEFQLQGMAFTSDNENADIGRESDAKVLV